MVKHSLAESFRFAISGISHAFGENRNVKIDFFFGVVAIFSGVFLRITKFEMITVLVIIILVISSEMINTSIEEMTDLITTEHRAEAKIAKDVAAGMVFVAALGAAIVGIVIFLPYIANLISF